MLVLVLTLGVACALFATITRATLARSWVGLQEPGRTWRAPIAGGSLLSAGQLGCSVRALTAMHAASTLALQAQWESSKGTGVTRITL